MVQDETQRLQQPTPQPPEPLPQPSVAPTAAPAESPAAPEQQTTPAPAAPPPAVAPRVPEHLRADREPTSAPGTGSATHPTDSGEPIYQPMALSVGAGFKFGCGFVLAVAMAVLAVFLVVSVAFFVATLVGLPLPIQ